MERTGYDIPIEISARHVHLSKKDFEALYGEGAELTYVKVKSGDYKFILAESLVGKVLGDEVEVLETYKGTDLEYMEYEQLIPALQVDKKAFFVTCDEYVTAEDGTGIVHIAPDHGMDDFTAARKYGIHPFVPIDGRGCYTSVVGPDFEGVYFEDGNEVSLNKMKETNTLLKVSKFTHSYPHDWRTKKPLIQRATDQWFCSIDGFRNKLLEEVILTKEREDKIHSVIQKMST